MLGIALLVFREVLEAALIVTVVAAATRGVPRRSVFVGGGIALGVIGAMGNGGQEGIRWGHIGMIAAKSFGIWLIATALKPP